MGRLRLSRRRFLQMGAGALGLSLPGVLGLRETRADGPRGTRGRAKGIIVLYCWGGMSHLETWDPKPNAPSEFRGEFNPIATTVPGIRISEHLPHLARQAQHLAIVRSIHHRSTFHGRGMYWNLTGHPTPDAESFTNLPPSRQDRPTLGALVSRFRSAPAGFPRFVQLPYPMVDNNTLQAGENAGWLGLAHDPILVRTDRGRPFGGVSRDLGAMVIQRDRDMDGRRLQSRQSLMDTVERQHALAGNRNYDYYRDMASEMLLSPRVQAAFNLDLEPLAIREAYGDHICGQSVLLGRRLSEAGVPALTVICAAGDLNGASGDHWDTHGNNFNRLKNDMLPPFDRAFATLVRDLAERGRLDETLVVMLTDFGRTPRINPGAGRDHYPNVYSVVLAGGGIKGGQVYGSSDRIGALPGDSPCMPGDIHATLFHALGIPADAHLPDHTGRPLVLCEGRVLPLI